MQSESAACLLQKGVPGLYQTKYTCKKYYKYPNIRPINVCRWHLEPRSGFFQIAGLAVSLCKKFYLEK